jgi:inactivated superfamily I helicase
MTDDEAWLKRRVIEVVQQNVQSTNALLAILKKPKFRHHLEAMAKMREGY